MPRLILAILLFTQTFLFSQTTEEEYNYLTKGYSIALESGLDTKVGYSLHKAKDVSINYFMDFKRKVSFFYFFKDDKANPVATLMIIERNETNFKKYLCIPHINSDGDIWKRAWENFSESLDGVDSTEQYSFGMLKMLSYLISSNIEEE